MKKITLLLGLFTCLCTASLRAQQFTPLFNGKSLDGWYVFLRDKTVPADSVFTVEDGMLHVSGRTFGYVCTNASYKNFHLILEFKWGVAKYPPRQNAKRDSGVLYYFSSSSPDKVWPRSIECQVQEGDCGDFWLVDSTSLSVNGKLYPPTKNQQVVKFSNTEKPNGEWNTLEIIGNNGKCTHILNGTVVNEGTDSNVREGKILLQCEGSEIFYRNIRLAVL
ncbi:MAG TPA: DUF1080 domain-containing protein [Chitinophagaceae bacterium]|nr:DUF1080 domain-containing protein [Chitinophagaceae bacterium]